MPRSRVSASSGARMDATVEHIVHAVKIVRTCNFYYRANMAAGNGGRGKSFGATRFASGDDNRSSPTVNLCLVNRLPSRTLCVGSMPLHRLAQLGISEAVC